MKKNETKHFAVQLMLINHKIFNFPHDWTRRHQKVFNHKNVHKTILEVSFSFSINFCVMLAKLHLSKFVKIKLKWLLGSSSLFKHKIQWPRKREMQTKAYWTILYPRIYKFVCFRNFPSFEKKICRFVWKVIWDNECH